MNNKVAIISDLHIGNNKDSEIFHNIHLQYAEWLKQQLIENNISNLIIAGDFFHNRSTISLATLHIGHLFLDILKDFNIVITSGNHCSYLLENSSVTSLSVFKTRKNITIVDEKVTIIDRITFCPWGTKIEDISPDSYIVIGHWDVQSFEMSKGKISTHGLKAADLMARCQIAFSGHYHKPQKRKYGDKCFHYLGSPLQLNFGEMDNNNYIHILDTDTLQVSLIENNISPKHYHIVHNIQLDKVPNNFISMDYSGEDSDILKKQIEMSNPLLLKIDKCVSKVEQITDEISDFKVVNIKDVLTSWPIDNLNNISPELKKRVADQALRMYSRYEQ